MTTPSAVAALTLALLSGMLGALLSAWIFIRREKRRMKLDTLREIIGNRFRMNDPAFYKPLNEIFVVYNDSPEVLKRLDAVVSNARRNKAGTPNPEANDDLVKLLRAMCENAKVSHSKVTDSFFLTSLQPGP